MPNPKRILDIPGARNFRDMGGYKGTDNRAIAWGRLFRSGHLADISTCNRTTVSNIGTVIDFRSDAEKNRTPVRWPEGWLPIYHAVPIGGNAAAWVQELYEKLSHSPFPAKELRDQFILAFETIPIANAEGLKQFFSVVANADSQKGVLFHCTAGKDRTGIAGALLLSALGVAADTVMEDFLLTNEAVNIEGSSTEIASRLSVRAGRTINPEDVLPLVGVEPSFLWAAFAAITREFDSVDRYLENELGVTKQVREKLHSLFLVS